MNGMIKLVASFALIALVLFAAGCASQSAEESSSTTTTVQESSDTDIIQDVDQGWSSDNDSVEIGEMV